MREIHFFDKAGNLIGTAKRQNCKRFSMQAAADHRAMDAFRKGHPETETAIIDGRLKFGFDVLGQSIFLTQ